MQKFYNYNQRMPNKTLILTGLSSVILHILILLTMYYRRNNYISCIMFDNVWYNSSITVLLIIEHTVWLHLLWTVACAPYHSLLVSYLAIFFLVVCWIMVVVIPMDPDPMRLHTVFAIFFTAGCIVNLSSSLMLLPGVNQGVDSSYKYILGILGLVGVLASLAWFTLWILNKTVGIQTNWLIEVDLQITAQKAYLAALAVGFYFYSK